MKRRLILIVFLLALPLSAAQAQAYLTTLFHKVVSQDSSARNSLQTFTAGRGDALLGYENEAITAQKKGEDVEYVIPDKTILIQAPTTRWLGSRLGLLEDGKNVR